MNHPSGMRFIVALVIMIAVSQTMFGSQNNITGFRHYLSKTADKLDFYFTAESVGPEGLGSSDFILQATVNDNPDVTEDLNTFIAYLTHDVRVMHNIGDTRIIKLAVDRHDRGRPILRIRDVRLSNLRGYVLDQRMSLKYEGTPFGLVKELSRVCPLVELQRVFSVGAGPLEVGDVQTPIKIAAHDKPLRDILTDCVPLSECKRLIWSSCTEGRKDSPHVILRFHGPRMNK